MCDLFLNVFFTMPVVYNFLSVSIPSTRWLRLLHHCMAGTFLSSTVSSIAQTAAQTPGLLTTCMALLASPHCRPNRRDIESLLLQLSRSRTDVGLALVDMFLRNNYSFGHGEHGKNYFLNVCYYTVKSAL